MKIAVYAIAKNEEKFAARFCQAAKDADYILVGDTGCTDDTRKIIQQWGGAVMPVHISPWRFDHARNAVLACLPSDVDVCISLDLDEELQPGWRAAIEAVWKVGETTRLRYFFDWGVGIKFKYEKIHARNGYFWHHPCHEYPMPDGRIPEVWADTEELLVIHKPDPTKSRGQYLDLLKLSVQEDPYCPRNAFYYARELSFHDQFDESIAECDRYLALPRANWPNERAYAYRVKGRCYNHKGDKQKSEQMFLMAASEAPHTREPWCELAQLMYEQARWPECLAFALRTLNIRDEEREMVYTVDPEVWGSKPYDLAAIAAFKLELYAVAKRYGDIALQKSPNDARIAKNLEFYNEKIVMSPEKVT